MYYKYGFYHFFNLDLIESSPLRLMDFGIERRRNEKYDYKNNSRGQYEGYLFQYTLSGSGMFETPSNQYQLSKGKAFLVSFPDDSRYYLPESKDQNWDFLFIHFTGNVGKTFLDEIYKITGPVFTLTEDSPSIRLFLDEFEAVRNGKQYQRYESGEWVYHFLTALLRDVETPYTKLNSKCIDEAIQWIQRNYATQINLTQMCSEIGVSLSHLTRQFQTEKGLSPMKYLTNIRLKHAINLLLNTSLSINEVAEKCGYSCGNYFTKVFKKSLFLSPSEYREMHSTYHHVIEESE
jgi:AraC-like DNA-binding protein